VDNSTEVTLNYTYDAARWANTEAVNGVQPMIFVTSMAALAIQVEGGMVTRVVRNEN
jgi:hypothetical protein